MTTPELDVDFVVAVHDEIIAETGGLQGFAGGGRGGVESALQRVSNHAQYAQLDDVFGIAAMYATAIARGHVFNDANKRTALVVALTYLARQGIVIRRDPILENAIVFLACGEWDYQAFAWFLWRLSQPAD